jgi:large subunit ribosomal protein L15
MKLHDVHRGIKRNKKRLRVGRGPGSGRGKTSGRGHKGQGQLAGWTSHPTFQGGQMPVVRRIPKRGFHNQFAKTVATVNVGELDAAFQSGDEVHVEALKSKGLIKGRFDVLKILGNGELTKRLKISAHRFSKSALEKIGQSQGEAVVIPEKGATSGEESNS